MITLYIKEQGSIIRRTGQRLIIQKGDNLLQTVRLRDVERVAIFGNVELTASACASLLENGIETSLLSLGGKFRGRLAPIEGKNVFLRMAQFQRYTDRDFRLGVGRALVGGKVRNARSVLQHHLWNHPSDSLRKAIVKLEASRDRALKQTNIDALLGAEGEAASVYFAAFGSMIRAGFTFTKRTRRPPLDPVNAVLSFGYTLLTTELTGALAALGLDPHVGLLHDLDYGRPSLALDLLEEFRQPVIDRLTLSLVNRGVLTDAHFEQRGDSAVLLNDLGRPRFLEFYHRSLEAEFRMGTEETRTCYREIIRSQAKRLRATIETGAEYTPFVAR